MLQDPILSRRELLQTGLAAAILPQLARPLHADVPAGVNFGFTLYGMRSLPVAEALQVCHTIGYDSVELACMTDWPSAPESLNSTQRGELRKQLADSNLTVASLMENVSPLGDEKSHATVLERLKRACGLAHDLAPQSAQLIETVLGGKPAEWELVRDLMATRLQDWARIAEAERVVIALKPHVGGALHTPDGAVWLMNRLQSPWLRLAYDFSHFDLQSIPFRESLGAMLPQTSFIHVKDAQGTAAKFQFLLPGEGRTDYAGYFRELKAGRYSGPVVVEVSGQIHMKPGYDPVKAAKQCYASLAPHIAAAGLRKAAQ